MRAKRFSCVWAGLLCLVLANSLGTPSATAQASSSSPLDSASMTPAQGTSPPSGGAASPQTVSGPGMVKALVVRSWGWSNPPQELVWEHLNQHWGLYGNIPVTIDYSKLNYPLTLQDLIALGPDVVIVSDAAGGGQQWSASEVTALEAYAQMGHNLVGTYALLQYSSTDNRALAPLWGLRSDLAYGGDDYAEASSSIFAPGHCLFKAISDPLDQGGFYRVQAPLDGSWDAGDFAGATVLARSPNGRNIVTEYVARSYRAFYISYMPEYVLVTLHPESTQYIYNAIVCPAGITAAAGTTWGALKVLYR